MKLIKVNFHGQELEVTSDRYVVIKDICVALGLDFTRQYRKLKSNPAYESKLLKVQTAGGVQEVFCIPLEKLNGWLFTINPNKVKPEIKDKLIKYQNECHRVLYEHFNHKSNNDKDLQAIIRGYKSQIAQKNKLIEELKNQKSLTDKTTDKDKELEELKKRLCQLLRWEEKKPVLPYRPFGRMILIDLIQSLQKQQQDLSFILEDLFRYRDTIRKYLFPIVTDFDIKKREEEIQIFFEIVKKEQESLKSSLATLWVDKGFVDKNLQSFVKTFPEINIPSNSKWDVSDFLTQRQNLMEI